MLSESPVSILQAARQGKLRHYLNQYVEFCYSQSLHGATNRRPAHRFPNFAGFCCFMGCGMTELTRLQSEYPEEANYIETVMEDEALNSPFMPASVLLLYLKARLDYGTPKESRSRNPKPQKPPVQIQCIYIPPETAESAEPKEPEEQGKKEKAPPPQEPMQKTAPPQPTHQQEPAPERPAKEPNKTRPARCSRQFHSSHFHIKPKPLSSHLSQPPSRYIILPRPPPDEKGVH